MALRKKRQPAQRRASLRNQKTKSYTVMIPPDPSVNMGDRAMMPSTSFVMPLNPPPDDTCQLMYWGGSSSGTQGTGLNSFPIGVDIQLNVAPPLLGPFSNISIQEFNQYWGQTSAAGQYFLPASVNLNLNFDFIITSQGGTPQNGSWQLYSLLPGMSVYNFRLTSKARVIRVNGSVENYHFELKNFHPALAFTSHPMEPGSGGGFGGVGNDWMQNGSSYLNPDTQYAHHWYFILGQIPVERCLWRYDNLTFHPQNQGLSLVNGPYGLDANFGVNMNQSIPITNYFEYGDRIILDGITAHVNPFWGYESCPFAFAIDEDGDGIADSYFGDYGGTVVDGQIIELPSQAGGPVQTVVPTETKILYVAN